MAEKVNTKFRKVWKSIYKNRMTILTIMAIVLVFFLIFGKNFMKIYDLERQKHALMDEIESEKERETYLKDEIDQSGEKAYIEKLARQKLNMYYPDETVVVIQKEEPAETQNKDAEAASEEAK